MLQYAELPEGMEDMIGRKRRVQERVSEIVATFEGPFDADDIIVAYKVRHGMILRRGSVNMTLCRLTENGEVSRIKKGVYKSPEEVVT